MEDQTILIAGAGEAGMGIGDLISYALHVEKGISLEEARKHIWYSDINGLLYKKRSGI